MQGIRIEISLKKDEKIYQIKWCKFYTIKMPHSKFIERSNIYDSGIGKCSCGKAFN